MNFPRPAVAIRWLLAGLVGGGGVWMLARVLANGSDWVAAFAISLFGLAAMIAGVLLASPEVVGWALLPLHRLLDSIFLPSESEPPPTDYRLARFYGARLRYEEACQEYEKIVRHHPEQFRACLEGIQAAARVGDEAKARWFHRAARRIARTEGRRSLLAGVYAARHSLPGPTANEQTHTPSEPAV